MKDFDERFFATDGADNADDSVAVGETVDDEPEKEEIPAELSGISEETAREIMAEAGDDSNDNEDETQEENAQPPAEADSDKKQYPADGVSNQRVPYGRFKETLDKQHALEEQNKQQAAQLAALQQQLSAFQQAQSNPPQPPAQQPKPQEQKQEPQINKDVVNQINELVKRQAMQMSGMSADDIEDLEFMDDDDPRKQSWDTAYGMAKMNVYAGIQQMQMQRQAKARQLLAQHEATIKDYNTFAQKEMQEPDFQQISNYAINDYFENGISKADQPAVAQAYTRIEQNTASQGDIALIKSYYSDAKKAYRQQHPAKAKRNVNNIKQKVQQAKSFPRSEQVEGAADVGGNVTAASLEQMMNTMDWDDIPEKYRQMLLRGYIS